MDHPGDSSNSSSNISSSNGNGSYFFENSLAGTLSGTLPGTLSASLPASLSNTPVLGDYSFSGVSAILGSSLQSVAIDLPLQQQVGSFGLYPTAQFDQQQQQQQQYHVQDGHLQHLGQHQLLGANGLDQQQNSQQYLQVQQYQLQMQVEQQNQQHQQHQHQQQAQQQPSYQPQYQVQPPQLSHQESYEHARQHHQQPQQPQQPQHPQQHQRYHQHHRHPSSDLRKQRQIQQATTRHKQKYLAALQKTSSPSQPRSHPVELVRRATTAYPAPACPSSMSSHPDHSMFPSYTFLEPNFITEASHKRQLERSRTQAIMSLSGSQPSSSTGLSPASQSMYSSASSLQSPRTPQTPQTPQAFQTFQTSQALQIPQFHQSRPGPGQQAQLRSFSQSMRKRQRSPPDHPAKRVRIAHTSSHLLDISDTGTPLEPKGNHLRLPSPPNPHTNYFPLLGPATPIRKRASPKGKGVASNDIQAQSSPSLHDAEMDSIITYRLEMLNRSNERELMAGMSTPVVEDIQAAISSVYVFLPYGHAAPVVRLLNQESFANVIQDLLSTAGKQAGNLRASEGMPAWQNAYLQKTASLHPQPQSFSSFQSIPSSQMLPKLPDARLLVSCVKMFSEHILATYPVIPRARLRNVVPRTLRHYGPEAQSQNQNQPPTDAVARLGLAVDLLVLALGSLCWARLDGTAFEPGPGFFVEAKSILGALTKQTLDNIENMGSMDTFGEGASAGKGKGRAGADTYEYSEYNQNAENIAPGFSGLAPSLDLARAYLLAAMFCGQMAYLQEAAEYVEAANVVIRYMLFQSAMVGEYELVSLVEQNHKPHPLSSRERQLVVLYWTCVQLELEICSEVGQTPSSLLRYQSLVPIPESDMYWPPSGESMQMQRGDINDAPQLDLGNLAPITMQVRLWRQLNTIYEEEYVRKKPASVIKEAVTKMKHQFEASTSPCPSSPTPDKSLMAARARTLYCEGRSYGVLNSLQSHLKVDVSEMAEVMLCLVDTIHAYHDLADDGRILSNSFGVAMIQCRYLLVLFAASRTIPAAAAVVSDDLISGLITGTLDSLPQTAGPNGVMEAARRVLHAMQTMLNQPQANQSQSKSQTQSQSQAVSTTAGLSLYCPPFSTWPEVLTAVPTATTATTASSFFQTPNTPHHMASPAYNANSNSPFGSPVSPATSCSPSPSSATYVPARRLFGGEKLVAFNSNASFMSTDSGYASQPLAASFPAPAPPAAPTFDMAAFARHLGLVRR